MSTPYSAQRVTRETLVEKSVFDYIKNELLVNRGYPSDRLQFEESFQTNLFEDEINRTYVAAGFHMDNGGKPAELGSNLRTKTYELEYWIVGRNRAEGSNVADAITAAVERDEVIPLLDYTQPGNPAIDFLIADPARKQRVATANPVPWQEHLYQVIVAVTDEFYAP